MNRLKLTILAFLALAAAGALTFRLAAQPEPYKPVPSSDAAYELILPPGIYQSLVIAFEGGANTKTVKATLKAPSGDMTVLIAGGETLVVPFSAAGWTISQQVPIKLTQPASQVFITAMTAAGPVKVDAAKK